MINLFKKPICLLVGLIALTAAVWAVTPADLPVFETIGSKEVSFGDTLDFTVKATDPKGRPVFYEASNLPTGATVHPRTGYFSWTPTIYQLGTFRLTFAAWDRQNPQRMANETIKVRVVFRKVRSEKGWGIGAKTGQVLIETTDIQDLYPYVSRLEIDGAALSLTQESYSVSAAPAVKVELASYYNIDKKKVAVLLDGERINIVAKNAIGALDRDGKLTRFVLSFKLSALKPGQHTLTVKAGNELGVNTQDFILIGAEATKP